MAAWLVGGGILHADAGDAGSRALVECFGLVADTFLEVEVYTVFASYGQGSTAPRCAPFGIW